MLHDPATLGDACARLRIRLLVLFGSHAGGAPAPGPDSDVDLAIAYQRGAPVPPFRDLFAALSEAFPDRTPDPVHLPDADPLFRWEILRRGRLLYGDVDDFLEYRAFAYRDFVDSADLRRLEEVLFEKKMAYVRERLDAAS